MNQGVIYENSSIMGKSVEIRFSRVVITACCLPLVSMFTCILIAIFIHSEETTRTHCKAQNYLPSISAAVGNKTPERYIWRMGIALHSFLRLMIAYLYYNFYQDVMIKGKVCCSIFVSFALFFHVIENICLLLMTYISSAENYPIHKCSFAGFLGFSMLYMAMTCYLFYRFGNLGFNVKNAKSYRYKMTCFALNVSFFLLCMYFFWRHNQYCENGIYSLFALFEYLIVLTNVVFHGTAVIDFRDCIFQVPLQSISFYESRTPYMWNI